MLQCSSVCTSKRRGRRRGSGWSGMLLRRRQPRCQSDGLVVIVFFTDLWENSWWLMTLSDLLLPHFPAPIHIIECCFLFTYLYIYNIQIYTTRRCLVIANKSSKVIIKQLGYFFGPPVTNRWLTCKQCWRPVMSYPIQTWPVKTSQGPWYSSIAHTILRLLVFYSNCPYARIL